MYHFLRRNYVDLSLFLFFGAAVVLLYSSVLNSYWLFEELQILKHAYQYHPWEYFLIPDVWREVSFANLMPWLTLSFDLDFTLFGFEPRWFYFHHLIALWVATILFYLVLGLWMPRVFAVLGALLFLVSAPTAAVSEMLMLRHYLEGAVLSLLSLYLFVKALREGSLPLALLSAFVFLLSVTAKEVYVPLAVIVFIIPEKNLRIRLKYAIPFLAMVILYSAWRFWMLGNAIGGYSNTPLPKNLQSDFLGIIVRNVKESIYMLSGDPPISNAVHIFTLILFTVLFLLTLLKLLYRRRFSLIMFSFIFFLSTYLPIFPLFNYFSTKEFQSYRLMFCVSIFYAFLISSALACIHPGFTERSSKNENKDKWYLKLVQRRVWSPMVLGVSLVILLLLLYSSQQWIHIQRKSFLRPLASEGRFVMIAHENSLIIKSFIPPGNNYYENLDYFKNILQNQKTPDVVYDIYAHLDEKDFYKLNETFAYKYSAKSNGMVHSTKDFLNKHEEYLSRIRKLPLFVIMKVNYGGISFSLGPSSSGRYILFAGYRPGVYCTVIEVSRHFDQKLFTSLQTYIRFAWESPEGWVTLSPEWFIDFSKTQEIKWEQ
jgi:hypothetical protein